MSPVKTERRTYCAWTGQFTRQTLALFETQLAKKIVNEVVCFGTPEYSPEQSQVV